MNQESSSTYLLLNGTAIGKATVLDEKALAPFDGNGPSTEAADVTKSILISETDVVVWVVDHYPFVEPKVPIIYGDTSDGWQANTTYHMPFNSTVDIIMSIAKNSMDQVSNLYPTPHSQKGSRIDHRLLIDGTPNASSRA